LLQFGDAVGVPARVVVLQAELAVGVAAPTEHHVFVVHGYGVHLPALNVADQLVLLVLFVFSEFDLGQVFDGTVMFQAQLAVLVVAALALHKPTFGQHHQETFAATQFLDWNVDVQFAQGAIVVLLNSVVGGELVRRVAVSSHKLN